MIKKYLLFIFLAGLWTNAFAVDMIPAVPELGVRSYVLMDADSSAILAEHRADDRLPPASLTKIMTSYVAAHEIAEGNISIEDLVPVSVNAWRTGGSRMFIRESTQVSLSDLLKGVVIQSGNDASIAVAEYVAGTEGAFAELMNIHAKNLGMRNSNFSNATGWPAEDHYSTARDLAKLAQALIKKFPHHYELYKEKEFAYNNITQTNRNLLLWRDPTVDGVKTGHTEEAGYCLVASAARNGMRLISVVMGADSMESRASESQKLLTYGFRFFETIVPYKAGEILNTPKLWMGEVDQVTLGLDHDLLLTIPRGKQGDLKAELKVDKYIKAPVSKGERMGTLTLTLEGNPLAERPVVALEEIAQGGIFKRFWHWLYLLILSFFE